MAEKTHEKDLSKGSQRLRQNSQTPRIKESFYNFWRVQGEKKGRNQNSIIPPDVNNTGSRETTEQCILNSERESLLTQNAILREAIALG